MSFKDVRVASLCTCKAFLEIEWRARLLLGGEKCEVRRFGAPASDDFLVKAAASLVYGVNNAIYSLSTTSL